MEHAWTIVLGVTTYLVGQCVVRFVLDPIAEQRRIIGEIASEIIVLANMSTHLPYQAPPEGLELVQPDDPLEAHRRVRKFAGRLRSTLWAIPLYDLWARLHMVLPRETINLATHKLILWSNSLFGGEPGAARDSIVSLLQLPPE
jgi:hypothetical protein